jgi:hypothetical protein
LTEITRQQLEQLIVQADVTPEKAKTALQTYFEMLVREANGELTPEIFHEADAFYDHTGFPTLIAEVLGLSIHQLQKELGRRRQVTCRECSQGFIVFEGRRIGGYSKSKKTRCKKCSRADWEASSERWQAEEARRRLEEQRRVQVDAEILTAITDGRDPLAIEPFREHLIRLALFWIVGRPIQYASNKGHYLGPGCMLCGEEESLDLWVMNVEAAAAIPDDSKLWHALRYCADYSPEGDALRDGQSYPGDVDWPPLTFPHQALWRLGPGNYFRSVPFLPLLRMPALVLCDNCSHITDGTHTKIELGEVQVTELEDGASAEAAGVTLFVSDRGRFL